jgi:hypothetical protein
MPPAPMPPPMVQARLVLLQGSSPLELKGSMQKQLLPAGQPLQVERVQLVGSPPLDSPPLLPKMPPLLPVLVPHWQVVVLQVVPAAQLPPQFAGQTQLLLAPQVAGGPQGGLQVSVTQALFTHALPVGQPLGPHGVPPSPTTTQAPLVVLQLYPELHWSEEVHLPQTPVVESQTGAEPRQSPSLQQ